jgi:flagellum-specific ATP synthase
MMIQAGLYAHGSDSNVDEAIACWPKLDAFLAEPELHSIHASFERLRKCVDHDDT